MLILVFEDISKSVRLNIWKSHVSTEIKLLQEDFKSTVKKYSKKTFSGQLRKYKSEMVVR